jgi:hypothetical protein
MQNSVGLSKSCSYQRNVISITIGELSQECTRVQILEEISERSASDSRIVQRTEEDSRYLGLKGQVEDARISD